MADPDAVRQVIGTQPPADPGRCERALCERMVESLLAESGAPILSDPMEYAPELVRASDLYRAGKGQPSLGAFVDTLRAALRAIGGG